MSGNDFRQRRADVIDAVNDLTQVHNSEMSGVRGKLNQSRATAEALRGVLAETEAARDAAVKELDSRGEVEPPTRDDPPTRPVEPPTRPDNGGGFPTGEDSKISVRGHDGIVMRLGVKAPEVWKVEEGWRFSVTRTQMPGLLCIVFLEQFSGFDATRVTVLIANVFKNRGAYLFESLDIEYGGKRVFRVLSDAQPGPDAIQVRGGLARRRVFGPDWQKIKQYQHVELADYLPDWCPELCEVGLSQVGNSYNMERVGLYNVHYPVVKGPSSLDGSHGGAGLSPYHFGSEGWQRCSRAGYQWAEADMFGTFDRSPIGIFEEKTNHPFNTHEPYWPGRENGEMPYYVQAPSGWTPDPDPTCPYLPHLEEFEAHDHTHGHRGHASAGMLADKDVFARFLLVEWYWHDYSMWMDGGAHNNPLLQPLQQIMSDYPANQGHTVAGRGMAHVTQCFLMAKPYMEQSKRDDSGSQYHPAIVDSASKARIPLRWDAHLKSFLEHVARFNGILHSQAQDAIFPWVKEAARSREVQLLQRGLKGFGLDTIAARASRTMSPMTRPGGMDSCTEAFDSRNDHWSKLPNSGNTSYFADYDILMGFMSRVDLSGPSAHSAMEQQIALIDPAWLKEQQR